MERIRPIDLLDELHAAGVRSRADLRRHIARRRAELEALEVLARVLAGEDDAERRTSNVERSTSNDEEDGAGAEDDEEGDLRRAQAGDREAMGRVIEGLEPLIAYVIGKANLPLPWDDQAQEARIAIMGALPRFDPDRGVKLKTFLGPRVFGAIRDYARRTGFLLHGGERTGRVERFERLDATIETANGDMRLLDVIPDGKDTAERLRHFEGRDEFSALVRGSTQRARQVLYLYFFEGLNQREVAEVLGVCESRISQVMKSELPRLRSLVERRNA